MIGLVVFGVILGVRLVELQLIRHKHFAKKASLAQTRKDLIPARRGEIYAQDGAGRSPLVLNQSLKLLYADPRYVGDKAEVVRKLIAVTGGDAADYQRRLERGIAYAVLAERLPNEVADRVKALKLPGIGLVDRDYRTYPEGSLAAQVIGFVNADGQGQYGIEQYLDEQLRGTDGQLAGKTDTHGIPIATADNVVKLPVNGKSYVLTIDRNIQAMVEAELARQVTEVKAKSGSVVVMDPSNGAIRAMATYPSFDPNQYSKVTDYKVFLNQAVASQFEPGSGIKAFTMAAGLDQGKVAPDSTFNDMGCQKVADRTICNVHRDGGGKKTMTVVLRDSLNTGVMHVLRMLGGDPDKITMAGKQMLYEYFTKHFGFGTRTGIEQAYEAAGVINLPSKVSGNDVNYANMSFGQGMSVTMVQMVAAMSVVANGGKFWQPHLVAAELQEDGSEKPVPPKLVRDHVISAKTAAETNRMLQVVVQRGSGYRAGLLNPHYKIAGKTGTAQIPRADGKGYEDGRNIGSFVGFAPAENPRFVMIVRINEPGVPGFAETTTVPVFGDICAWLFKYYGIPPSS